MIDIDLEPLVNLLDHGTPAVRLAAALALARGGDPRGVPVLLEGLGHASPRVRAQCALALGEWYDLRTEHIARLAAGLFDPACEVQIATVAALRRMRQDVVLRVAEHLLRAADEDRAADRMEEAARKQRLAARLVGIAAMPDGVDVLRAVEQAVQGRDREAWGDVVWALGEIDDDEARNWLLELAREYTPGVGGEGEYSITMQFVRALARQRTPEALTILATWTANVPELGPAIARFVTPSPLKAPGYLVEMDPFELFDALLGTEMFTVRQGSRVVSFYPAGDDRYVVVIEEGEPGRSFYRPNRVLLLDPRMNGLREEARAEAERLLRMVEPARRLRQALREQNRLGYEVEVVFDDDGNVVGVAYQEEEIEDEEVLALMERLFGNRRYDLVPAG